MAAVSPVGPPPTMMRSYDRHLRRTAETELVRELIVTGFSEVRAVGKEDGGNGAGTMVHPLDDVGGLRVGFEIDPVVGDALISEKRLRTSTVWAPTRPNDGDDVGVDLHRCSFHEPVKNCLATLARRYVGL